MQDESNGHRRVVLAELGKLLRTIGSAYDAQDHGCAEEAQVMWRESYEGIVELMSKHPFLTEVLPGLQRAVDSGYVLGGGWAKLLDRVDEHMKALGE